MVLCKYHACYKAVLTRQEARYEMHVHDIHVPENTLRINTLLYSIYLGFFDSL